MRERRTWMVVLFVLVAVTSQALPHEVGEALFDVDVRSRTQLLIPQGYVKFQDRGGSVLVQARAAGYVGQDRAVSKPAPGQRIKLSFTLADPVKDIVVMSTIGERLTAAAVDTRQFGYAPELFGITVLIPAKDWPRPATDRIKIVEGVFGTAITYTSTIEHVEDFVRVRLTAERGYLMTCGRHLFVMVNLDRGIPDERAATLIQSLNRAEKEPTISRERLEETAAFLSPMLSEVQLERLQGRGLAVPASLERFQGSQRRFFELHRD